MLTGHVFVTRGDITRLRVDAWVLPSDRAASVTEGWFSERFTRHQLNRALEDGYLEDFRSERVLAAALPMEEGQPTPVLTAVPYFGAVSFEELRERIQAGVRTAAETARAKGSQRPIVATPAFGVGGGGADRSRGEVVSGILEVAREAAEKHEVDVIVCLQDEVDHALAQRARLAEWESAPPLEPARMGHVRRLADMIKEGRLVPFMGSGVSASAGLPSWSALLASLTSDRPDKLDPQGWFSKLSALDQAHVVRGDRNKVEFGKAVASRTSAERYGLPPILLAALPTREAVTLNYDRLYEIASKDSGVATATLPFEALGNSRRWLLKMHGCVSRPESIVLTREDYIDFRSDGATVASLAKAILMTKHLLFVGFGLADDHFHDLVHEVGKSWPDQGAFGTALVLGESLGHRAVWGDRINFVTFTEEPIGVAARALEIFLDVLGAYATLSEEFVLDERYDSEISPAEREAKEHLLAFLRQQKSGMEGTVIGRELTALRKRLGG